MVGLSPPAVALAPSDGDLNRIARFITMQYFISKKWAMVASLEFLGGSGEGIENLAPDTLIRLG